MYKGQQEDWGSRRPFIHWRTDFSFWILAAVAGGSAVV